jgi:hypothetical protein
MTVAVQVQPDTAVVYPAPGLPSETTSFSVGPFISQTILAPLSLCSRMSALPSPL